MLTSVQVVMLVDVDETSSCLPCIGIRKLGRDIAEFYDLVDRQYFHAYWYPIGEMSIDNVIDTYAKAYVTNKMRHGSKCGLMAIRDIVEAYICSIPDNVQRITYLKQLIYCKGMNTDFVDNMLDQVINNECQMRFMHHKARVIQSAYRYAIADPYVALCVNRLLREAMELIEEI